MQMLPSQMVSFWEVHVFHLLKWIRLFGGKRSFPHFENYDLQEVFFQKETQVSHENKVLYSLQLTQISFFRDTHMFHKLTWAGLFARKWDFLYLEKYQLPVLSLQNLWEVSQENNVVETPASIKKVFSLGMHVFHQLSWRGLFSTQCAYLQVENYD